MIYSNPRNRSFMCIINVKDDNILNEAGGIIEGYKINFFTKGENTNNKLEHGPRIKFIEFGVSVAINRSGCCVDLDNTQYDRRRVHDSELKDIIKLSYAIAEFMAPQIIDFFDNGSDLNKFNLESRINMFNNLSKSERNELRKAGHSKHIGRLK